MKTELSIALPEWLSDLLARGKVLAAGEARMSFVIELARLNVLHGTGGPFAAGVFEVESGRLLAAGVNVVVANACSSAHAEILALSLAQQSAGAFDLGAAGHPPLELVSSCAPCAMCLGAVVWSGVRRLVYAALEADARAIGFDEGPKHADWAGELARRGIAVEAGLLRVEAVAVLESYRATGGPIYNARSGGDPSASS